MIPAIAYCAPSFSKPTLQTLTSIKAPLNFSLANETPDPKAFSKDCDRLRKVLAIDNTKVSELYQGLFKQTARCEAREKLCLEVLKEEQGKKEPDQELINDLKEDYEKAQEAVERQKKGRGEEIEKQFISYLNSKLGDKRAHLVDKITWIFSQKALTAATTKIVQYIHDKLGGYFATSKDVSKNITLNIPKNQTLPVQVTARSETDYQEFFPAGQRNRDARPIKIKMDVTYTIGLDETVKANGNFAIPEINDGFHIVDSEDYESEIAPSTDSSPEESDEDSNELGRSESFCMVDGKMLGQLNAHFGRQSF